MHVIYDKIFRFYVLVCNCFSMRKRKIGKFKKLSLSVQSAYLWTDGEIISTNYMGNAMFLLYAMYGHMVEVKLKRNSKQIEAITILDFHANLDRYLDKIELPEEILP